MPDVVAAMSRLRLLGFPVAGSNASSHPGGDCHAGWKLDSNDLFFPKQPTNQNPYISIVGASLNTKKFPEFIALSQGRGETLATKNV